jgi:hypothetical protein
MIMSVETRSGTGSFPRPEEEKEKDDGTNQGRGDRHGMEYGLHQP